MVGQSKMVHLLCKIIAVNKCHGYWLSIPFPFVELDSACKSKNVSSTSKKFLPKVKYNIDLCAICAI